MEIPPWDVVPLNSRSIRVCPGARRVRPVAPTGWCRGKALKGDGGFQMVAAMDFKKCRNASEHWRWLHFRSRRVLTSANKPDHGNSIKLGASLILAESRNSFPARHTRGHASPTAPPEYLSAKWVRTRLCQPPCRRRRTPFQPSRCQRSGLDGHDCEVQNRPVARLQTGSSLAKVRDANEAAFCDRTFDSSRRKRLLHNEQCSLAGKARSKM